MIASKMPDALHICPACGVGLAEGMAVCEGCRGMYERYVSMVSDGRVEATVPLTDVLEILDAHAPSCVARDHAKAQQDASEASYRKGVRVGMVALAALEAWVAGMAYAIWFLLHHLK